MISKLTAQFALIFFILTSFLALFLHGIVNYPISFDIFFQYQILAVIGILILGKPLTKLALDLVRNVYREHQEDFPVPGAKLPETKGDESLIPTAKVDTDKEESA